MIFTIHKSYEITFKTGESIKFRVLNSTPNFYLIRVMNIDTKESTFLFKLMEKEWVKLEEIKIAPEATEDPK